MKTASDKCAFYSSVLLIIMLYGGVSFWIFVANAHEPDAFEFTKVYLEVFNLFFVIAYFMYLFADVIDIKEEVIAQQVKVS